MRLPPCCPVAPTTVRSLLMLDVAERCRYAQFRLLSKRVGKIRIFFCRGSSASREYPPSSIISGGGPLRSRTRNSATRRTRKSAGLVSMIGNFEAERCQANSRNREMFWTIFLSKMQGNPSGRWCEFRGCRPNSKTSLLSIQHKASNSLYHNFFQANIKDHGTHLKRKHC